MRLVLAALVLLVFAAPSTASAATCPTPTGLFVSAKTSTSVTIKWTAAAGATKYTTQVRTDPAQTYIQQHSVTATQDTFTGLKPSTAYWFRVYSYCGTTGGGWTANVSTTTLAADPTPTPTPTATPTPTPTPSGSDWSYGYDTWSSEGHVWPAGDLWRPFAASSPFNMKVPAAPVLAAGSATKVARLKAWQAAPGNLTSAPSAGNDYGHPYYFADPTDRLLTIHCTKYGSGVCAGIEGLQVRVPAGAQASSGTDHHIGIVEGTRIVDVYNAGTIPSSGTWNVGAGQLTYLDGSGVHAFGSAPGATAAGFSLLAGMLRGQDLAAGHIPHGTFGVVKCTTGYVYPAVHPARDCASKGWETDGPRNGDWLYLDMTDAEITSLTNADGSALKPSMRTILRAWREYGIHIGDTGGYELAKPESAAMYTSMGVTSPIHAQGIAENWVLYNGERLLKYSQLPSWVWDRLRVIDPCVAQSTC